MNREGHSDILKKVSIKFTYSDVITYIDSN